MSNFWLILVCIYFFGFILAFYQSIRWYFLLHSSDAEAREAITHGMNPALFLIQRVVLWPYYVFCYKSPLTYISEVFFSSYGDSGKRYFGSRGVKNFWYDILYRKKYLAVKSYRFLIPLSNDSSIYQQAKGAFESNKVDMSYASIISGKLKNSYLLSVKLCSDYQNYDPKPVSRYELYACHQLSKKEFIATLKSISLDKAEDILTKVENN